MAKKDPYYGKSMSINFPEFVKYTIGWKSDGKKAPMLWEKYGYRFPRLSPYHEFCRIFPYCGKFMGNPCISHMLKYTIRWESDEKKSSHTMGKV